MVFLSHQTLYGLEELQMYLIHDHQTVLCKIMGLDY